MLTVIELERKKTRKQESKRGAWPAQFIEHVTDSWSWGHEFKPHGGHTAYFKKRNKKEEGKNITKTHTRKKKHEKQDYSPLEKFYTSKAAKIPILRIITIPEAQPSGSLRKIFE